MSDRPPADARAAGRGKGLPAEDDRTAAREWWLRTTLVLQAPRAVFVALRDDSNDASDRAEPVLLIVWLAGMASVLSTATAGRLMDTHE